jgi:hypothetical protein
MIIFYIGDPAGDRRFASTACNRTLTVELTDNHADRNVS